VSAHRDRSAMCKQLKSGYDAELFGVSFGSNVFDTKSIST